MSAKVRAVFGEDARAFLVDALAAAKNSDPFAPVTVLASTMRAATQLRHDIARDVAMGGNSGIANVRFTVMSRLAELMGAPALRASGRRQLDRNSLGAAVRAELASRFTFLSNVAHHPSAESEVVHLYEEVRYLSDEGRAQLSTFGRREHELMSIIDGVRERLVSIAYDDVDLFASASASALDSQIRATYGTVIVYLPQRLRSTETQFIVALAQCGEVECEIGRFGDDVADPIGAKMLADLCSALDSAPVESSESMTRSTKSRLGPFERVIVAPEQSGEVREAVAIIREQLVNGVRPERLGICYPKSVPYLRLLAFELDAAQIPWNGPACDVIRAAPTCQFLLHLLQIAEGPLTRTALMELLSSAGVQSANGDAIAIGEWQRCSRLTGLVVGDERTWSTRLRALVDEASADRARLRSAAKSGATPQGSSARRFDRAERTIVAARGLGRFLEDLFGVANELRQATSHAQFVAIAKTALNRFLGPQELRCDQPFPLGEQETSLIAVLDELVLVDDLQRETSLAGFIAALDVALSRPGPPNGRSGLGVFVGDLSALAGLELDLLVVTGCAEGDLPGIETSSPLLSATSREAVGLDVTTKPAVVSRDEHRLMEALFGVRTSVAILPAVDVMRNQRRLVSRFVGAEVPVTQTGPWTASFGEVASGRRSATNLSELYCSALLDARHRRESLSENVVIQSISDLEHAVLAVLSRDRLKFDRFSGQVSGRDLGELLFSESFSPTTLEEYATCPFRYFVDHELSCEVIDVPEQRLYIDARVRGTMVHEILERYYGEQLANATEDGEQIVERSAIGSGERLNEIANEVMNRYERLGVTGRRALWEPIRRKLLRDLHHEREMDLDQRAREGFLPIVVEHSFGYGEAVAPVAVTISSGPLSFRGKIDRIDANADGALRVLDYKTGKSGDFKALRDDPVDRGRHLQLPVYAAAAAASNLSSSSANASVDARFRFVGRPEDDVSYVLTEENADRFVEALDTVVTSIRSGLFPMHPGASDRGSWKNCQWCDFGAICPSDRLRRWESIHSDQRLHAYVQLCEGAPASTEAPS